METVSIRWQRIKRWWHRWLNQIQNHLNHRFRVFFYYRRIHHITLQNQSKQTLHPINPLSHPINSDTLFNKLIISNIMFFVTWVISPFFNYPAPIKKTTLRYWSIAPFNKRRTIYLPIKYCSEYDLESKMSIPIKSSQLVSEKWNTIDSTSGWEIDFLVISSFSLKE